MMNNNENKILSKIEELEKTLKRGEEIQIEANANIKNLQSQYREENAKLKELGVDPKKEEEALKEIDAEIEKLLKEIDKEIPHEIIKNYNGNIYGLENGDNSIF